MKTVKRDEPSYIRATFQTGEVVELRFRDAGAADAQLLIENHITFVGGAWQRDRRSDVLWAVRKSLDMRRRAG